MRVALYLLCLPLVVAAAVGCIEPATTLHDNLLCPPQTFAINGECITEAELAACRDLAAGSTCQVGEVIGACHGGACRVVVCGDAKRQGAEACDDGNTVGGDGCAANCASDESCGNAVLDPGEACDAGAANADAPDADCRTDCTTRRCGDGVVDSLESCDEGLGNADSPNATCRSNCTAQRCGDGIVDGAEICDDGNQTSGDGCSYDCMSHETCGNGYLDRNPAEPSKDEQCDPDLVAGRSHDGCDSNCQREYPAWRRNLGLTPSARHSAGMAFDVARGFMVLFGGNSENRPERDTWLRDPITGSWRLIPTTISPSANNIVLRYFASSVPEQSGVIALSGSGTFRFTGTDWVLVDSTFIPPIDFNMSFDAQRQRLVLFGGTRSSNAVAETWEFDGAAWIQRTPATSPPRRYSHGQAYFAYGTSAGTIIHGGYGGGRLNDTWRWDGNTWTEVSTAQAPPARYEAAMEYSPNLRKAVLFGGASSYADTWIFDGNNWTQAIPSAAPAGRFSASTAYDPRNESIALFGGTVDDALFSDYWTFRTTSWRDSTVVAPSARAWAAMDANPAGVALLIGGHAVPEEAGWLGIRETDGAGQAVLSWRQLELSEHPPRVAGGSMVYDTKRQRWLLFAGGAHIVAEAELTSELWEFRLAPNGALTGTWTKLAPAVTPPPRRQHSAYYDPIRDRMVVFGGYGLRPDNSYGTLADTWEFDGAQWLQIMPASAPATRYAHAMQYDLRAQRGVLFGGTSSGGSNETWTWDGTNWTQLMPSVSPSARRMACLTYHPLRQSLIMFGGEQSSANFPGDTWELAGNEWRLLAGASPPPARRGASCFFDNAAAELVIFGGGSSAGYRNDLWRLAYTAVSPQTQQCDEGQQDTDNDGLASTLDPDCWWTAAAPCPPDTSCTP